MEVRRPLAPAAHGAWMPYHGLQALVLTLILLAVAAALAYAGIRLREPFRAKRPGRTVAAFMIIVWALTICTFLTAIRVYGIQIRETHTGFYLPKVQVGTYLYALVTFFIVVYLTRRHGWGTALASGFVAAAAAPMFFEFPFDLIVMGRTYPVIPPNPALFRALFFFPLLAVEFSTISLLTLLPTARLTKNTLYALAAMFLIFAVWAADGFAYPSQPLPLALNVVGKILCFVAAIMLFV